MFATGLVIETCRIIHLCNIITKEKMIRVGLRLLGCDGLRFHLRPESTNRSREVLSHVFYNHHLSRFCSVAPPNLTIGEKGLSDSPLVQSIIDSLQVLSLNENEIKRIIKNQPNLVNYSKSSWEYVINLFLGINIPKSNIYDILEKCPELLSINRSTLNKAVLTWVSSGISPALYIDIITHHPSFLKLDSQFVAKRIKQFQLYFEGKSRAGRLFLISPNAMTENMDSILKKINYLNELCREREEIVMSSALSYSLFHIMARHEFLIRAGLYKRPQKNYDRRLDKNPKLEIIVNTPDKEYVSKLTPLSLFEYEVFLEMFKTELDSEIDDSDSDNEEDNKSSYIMHNKKHKKRNR